MSYTEEVAKIILQKRDEIRELLVERIGWVIERSIPRELESKINAPVRLYKHSDLSNIELRISMAERDAIDLLVNWEKYGKAGQEFKVYLLPPPIHVEYLITMNLPPRNTLLPIILQMDLEVEAIVSGIPTTPTSGGTNYTLKDIQFAYITLTDNPTVTIHYPRFSKATLSVPLTIFSRESFPSTTPQPSGVVIEKIAKALAALTAALHHPGGIWQFTQRLVHDLKREINANAKKYNITVDIIRRDDAIKIDLPLEATTILTFSFYIMLEKEPDTKEKLHLKIRFIEDEKDRKKEVKLNFQFGLNVTYDYNIPTRVDKERNIAILEYRPHEIFTSEFLRNVIAYLLRV